MLPDEPLIFVEVALVEGLATAVQPLLSHDTDENVRRAQAERADTAIFYSISNCQDGLRGVSFGNFLIKQVVEELVKERASLRTFVTLSPIPQFASWLARTLAGEGGSLVNDIERERIRLLDDPDWIYTYGNEGVRPLLMRLAAEYFLNAKNGEGYPIDPVARFHLGNGARLERINWQGDISAKGLREAHGLMCNYRYELKDIEKNHEAYENDGIVAASRQVHALLKLERGRSEAGRFLQLPGLRTARSGQGKEESE